MSWEKCRLGDLINFKRGYDLPSRLRKKGRVPIISSSGISDYHNTIKKTGEGVVTGRYGTLGKIFYINGNYWPLNTTLYVTDFKGNCPKFMYYFLKILQLEQFNGAAAVPGLDRKVLHRIPVFFPKNIETQKKIASILSNYDELIENNKRRIAILEEIAAEMYKEWFVRLRFPNWKETKMVDGIPDGWKRCPLRDVLEYQRGKSYRSSDLSENKGLPFINLKCIQRGGGFRRNGLKFYIGKYKESELVEEGDIVLAITDMTQSRDLVGRVARVPNMKEYDAFMISMDLIKIIPKEVSKLFLYCSLRYSNFGLEIKEFANGANVLHLNPELVKFQKIIVPTKNLIEEFESIILPMMEEIDILKNKNTILQKTRDLLLPRLVSGKLSVAHLVESSSTPREF